MDLLNNLFTRAEDDSLRSQYIHGIVSENIRINEGKAHHEIPKVIVQFWHNIAEIPTDVQECIDSWESLGSRGFKRVLFDESSARNFILKEMGDSNVSVFERCHHPAMKCDYFRLCYLLVHGGFYVDADEVYQGLDVDHLFQDGTLKIQPLCYDNETGEMVSPSGFIGRKEYSPDWTYYVNNNPLIAPANHPVIRLALDRATNIILNNPIEELEIQSTTGPGNLTASLVKHSTILESNCEPIDFTVLPNWDEISISKWPLSYRNDDRNWRLWKPSKMES